MFGVSSADSSPCNWEVVQSVVHQTLDLIILVRVQASQPIFSINQLSRLQGFGNFWEQQLLEFCSVHRAETFLRSVCRRLVLWWATNARALAGSYRLLSLSIHFDS